MNERTHRYLDGKLRRDALTPQELEEVVRCELFIREAGEIWRSVEVPDLAERVMSKLPTEIPTKTSKSVVSRRATRGVPSGFVEDSLRWLWTPRPIRFRPAFGLLAIAGLFLILVLPNVSSRLVLQTSKTAIGGINGDHLASKVFVQFRLDAPHASAVRLAGSFTGWKPTYALQQVTSGVWSILIPLEPGVHDYAFVVDGAEWVADPAAPKVDDGFGGINSRLSVLLPNGDSRL
jgi:hypothetical protein